MAKPGADADAKQQARDSRDHQILQELGDRIRALRHQRGLTQERLAERAGLTPKFLGEVERVETNPSATSLRRIAEGLAVGVGDLFDVTSATVPIATAALARLDEAFQALGESITDLTRADLPARPMPGKASPAGRGGRARNSRKD